MGSGDERCRATSRVAEMECLRRPDCASARGLTRRSQLVVSSKRSPKLDQTTTYLRMKSLLRKSVVGNFFTAMSLDHHHMGDSLRLWSALECSSSLSSWDFWVSAALASSTQAGAVDSGASVLVCSCLLADFRATSLGEYTRRSVDRIGAKTR